MRGGAAIIALLASLAAAFAGEAPLWPVPGKAFERGEPYAAFLQPTASGEPESALFGCVRTNGRRFHEAIDIAPVLPRRRGEATDPVRAVHAGRVVHVNRIAGNSSYGRYVVLEHPGLQPAIYTLYAHLATIADGIEPGMEVDRRAELGIMGRSAGGYVIPRSRAHLHLEVGLRLSGDFQSWYDRQGYESENHHGDFNGMNLIGWDPLDYFAAWREGRVSSLLEYIEGLEPGILLHIRTRRYPDFLERYPQLKLDGCSEPQRAGWELILTAWGLPVSLKPLTENELRGVRHAGDISILAINRPALEAFACRKIVSGRNGRFVLASGGHHILELLFKPE